MSLFCVTYLPNHDATFGWLKTECIEDPAATSVGAFIRNNARFMEIEQTATVHEVSTQKMHKLNMQAHKESGEYQKQKYIKEHEDEETT